MSELRNAVEKVLPSVRSDLEDLVRIPSISADPNGRTSVMRSARAVADLARQAGAGTVDIKSVPGGDPAVVAHWPRTAWQPPVLV